MNAVCTICGDPLRTVRHAAVEHQVGPVRALAEPRQGLGCARGCGTDVDSSVRRALNDRILIASRRRWPRSADRCGACGATLDLPLRATTRAVTVEPGAGAPFTITLGLPLSRCPGCGSDNVPASLAGAVRRATATAAGAPADTADVTGVSPLRRRVGRGSPGPP